MASGRVHDSFCLYSAALMGALASGFGLPWLMVGGCVGGGLAGLVVSPDLDCYSLSYYRWQAAGLGWVWEPYRRALVHRSRFSHLPVIGTVIRLLYLTGMLVLTGVLLLGLAIALAWAAGWVNPVSAQVLIDGVNLVVFWLVFYVEQIAMVAVAMFGGLMVADVAHWALDGCPLGPGSHHKRRR